MRTSANVFKGCGCAMTIIGATVAAIPWCSFARTEMALAKVPQCEVWKLSKVEARQAVEAEWHEAGDGTWFTNSVGEEISVEQYCAVGNCAEEREVKPLLDKYYNRCRPDVIQKLYESNDERRDGLFWKNRFTCDKRGKVLKGSEDVQAEVTAWRIAGNLYLVLSADDSGRMKIRIYTFVLFDGKSRRTVAEFDYLPDPEVMNSILSVWTVPDAVNNVAAMYYNNTAWTHFADDDYVVRLLLVAARFGSVTACENLAKLGHDRRWSRGRVERWRRFAEACRNAIDAGWVPKMELNSILDWPRSRAGDY